MDPLGDTEIVAATALQITEWYDNYKLVKLGPPLPGKEPTPDQLAAMHTRVVELSLVPYADFPSSPHMVVAWPSA